MPTDFAVLETLPSFFFNCFTKYSFSKLSLASFNVNSVDTDLFLSIFNLGFKVLYIIFSIFSILS